MLQATKVSCRSLGSGLRRRIISAIIIKIRRISRVRVTLPLTGQPVVEGASCAKTLLARLLARTDAHNAIMHLPVS